MSCTPTGIEPMEQEREREREPRSGYDKFSILTSVSCLMQLLL